MQPGVYKSVRWVEKHMTGPLVVACSYEAVALTFPCKRIPPISVLARRHRWVFPVFCGVLGLHIWFYEETRA